MKEFTKGEDVIMIKLIYQLSQSKFIKSKINRLVGQKRKIIWT